MIGSIECTDAWSTLESTCEPTVSYLLFITWPHLVRKLNFYRRERRPSQVSRFCYHSTLWWKKEKYLQNPLHRNTFGFYLFFFLTKCGVYTFKCKQSSLPSTIWSRRKGSLCTQISRSYVASYSFSHVPIGWGAYRISNKQKIWRKLSFKILIYWAFQIYNIR